MNKDPIIFIVPEYVGDEIFSLINISEEYSRYVYVLHNFDLNRVFAYLVSFSDLDKRNVMIFAPKKDSAQVKSFSANVFGLVVKYTGVKIKDANILDKYNKDREVKQKDYFKIRRSAS